MDYSRLRREGIELIAKLAGDRWTDYNTHDPGITILEAWCYALTDLSYRLDFTIAELLASPPEESASPLFLTARESLTTEPLTINDYRKLLIDIDGVKNAWLEPIAEPVPAIYYDAQNAKLTFSNLDSLSIAEPVHLRGLYRVLLEADPRLPLDAATALVPKAKAKLHQHRNLCEDFAAIDLLQTETIAVHLELTIADEAEPHQLLAQLYTALEQAISPTPKFLTLSELLAQETPTEEILLGPALEHGFIDDAQLEECDRPTELRTSDLIRVILDFDAVQTVQTIALSSSSTATPQPWVLGLNPELTPRLKPLKEMLGDITVYKGQIPFPLDSEQVKVALMAQSPPQTASAPTPQDLPIPPGDYRNLADYESLQSEFPLVYGIGELGLPPSASPQRQAQAKQLQAYLMVFDQLLADYFAQLDQVRRLLDPSNAELTGLFAKSSSHFPGAETILRDLDTALEEPAKNALLDQLNRNLSHHQNIDELSAALSNYLQAEILKHLGQLPSDGTATSLEPALQALRNSLKQHLATASDRKNRLLDHLAVQYGESFIDFSLLYGNDTSPDAAIAHKAAFNAHYRAVSAGRANGFNYLLHPRQTDNISGFKHRVSRLLGIEPQRRSLKTNDKAQSSNIEGFYIVEHLLLRPRPQTATIPKTSRGDLLSFSRPITAYQAIGEQVSCTSIDHGLQAGDTINVLYSSHYNGIYTVPATGLTTDTFILDTEFVADYSPERDAWVRQDRHPDPFSFQVSIVLPNWPRRFAKESFRQLVYNTLTAEVPAHITLQLHWLNASQMSTFEVLHDLWLQQLSDTANANDEAQAAAQAAANQLIDFLGLGSTDIPEIPNLVGYMTITDEETDTPPPDFTVA